MTHLTVYPIIQTLSKSEQIKLLNKLKKDIQVKEESIVIDHEKNECLTWLKNNIFYPPK